MSVILFVLLLSCQPSVREAIDYNESIVAHHEDIYKKLAFLKETYHEFIPQDMDSAYHKVLGSAQEGIDFATNLEPFHGDESYQKIALSLFALYKSVIEEEHARIIELFKLPEGKYKQAEIDEVDRLNETADQKLSQKIEEVAKVQAEFAKKYNFTIDDQKSDLE